MTMPPLIVYLDTQDYIRLFNEADNGPNHKILDQLLCFRDRGDIVIGYSWVIMLEFITRGSGKFSQDRVRRGQLVKDICGRNAFPFFSDLKRGARFPNNGIWITGRDGTLITAKSCRNHIKKRYLESLAALDGLNRAQRRQFRTQTAMRQLLRESTSTWGTKREDFKGIPVTDDFIESGIMTRFLKGRCSDAEFEERINRWLSDPTEFSRIVYDYSDSPNLKDEFFGASIEKMKQAMAQIQEAIFRMDDLKKSMHDNRKKLLDAGLDKCTVKKITTPTKLKARHPSSLVEKIEVHVGSGRAGHVEHYMRKATRKGYKFEDSDPMDIMQMFYVPDCDLFRCDKAMADLYRDYEPFAGKLVAKFADLPARIESQLLHRSN